MPRLHAFGCSHTFGEGITKADVRGSKYPSKNSWPAHLSSKLKIELINHAIPGSSNHNILNQVKTANFLSRDIAVIMFTYYDRSVYYHEDGKEDHINLPSRWTPINALKKKTKEYSFYKLFSNYHMERISLYDIEHTYLYLMNQGISFVPMFLEKVPDRHKKAVMQRVYDDSAYTVRDISNKVPEYLQHGADGKHWSAKVHKRIAQYAYDKIQLLTTDL